MLRRTSDSSSSQNDDSSDLSQIFVGRQQELELFQLYLNRWKNLLFDTDPDDTLVVEAPSPNKKIQGLVMLLYGRGGFGKSTLLRRYYNVAVENNDNPLSSKLTISGIIDWEFAVEGKRGLFNPLPGQEVNAAEYFKLLCGQLAIAFRKKPQEFKAYQSAARDVEKVWRKAAGVLDSARRDDHYAAIREMSIEGIATAIGVLSPRVGKIVENPKVQAAAGEGVQIALALVQQKLRDKLGKQLGDFLEPALRLGLALGRDLHEFARDYPLLIFFDTYEEIDEGDRYLRLVMGAAGMRVGWVIAGRDNLWAGAGQTERSIALEYGYKDMVVLDRGHAIDFNAGGVGAFTISDIRSYFDLLRRKAHNNPSLHKITEEEAKRIQEVTKGVPLAIKIAAELYLETADLNTVTVNMEGRREIIDQMVRRYLLHARDSESERSKLYGLAMLRRVNQPAAVAAALGLTPEQAKTDYRSALRHFHRRYSFIFTEKEKEEPTLHEEVRNFLRLWLLERYTQEEIRNVNFRLIESHEAALKSLEDQRKYRSLNARFEDEQWIGSYLDLTEQQFWLEPWDGVRYALPFMIAALVYRRSAMQDLAKVGQFFEAKMVSPYRNWWQWTIAILASPLLSSVRHQLEELARVVSEEEVGFPFPLSDYHSEIEALSWWQLGKAHLLQYNDTALEWYEKTLPRLEQEAQLKKDVAEASFYQFLLLRDRKRYAEAIPFMDRAIEFGLKYALDYVERGVTYNNLAYASKNASDKESGYQRAIEDFNRAIELDPNYARAYANRGNTYYNLKRYEQAVKDLNTAIELNPEDAYAYVRRGDAYNSLGQHDQALQDHNRAIELDPRDAEAYYCRGFTHLWQRNVFQAVADFEYSRKLDPTDIYAAWAFEWASMGKGRDGIERARRLESIAILNPEHYIASIIRGLSLGLGGKLKEGLQVIEQAIPLDTEGDAYFWKGMLCAYFYRGRPQVALELVEKSLENGLPPILLIPLYWLEKDESDNFNKFVKPLLEKYGV